MSDISVMLIFDISEQTTKSQAVSLYVYIEDIYYTELSSINIYFLFTLGPWGKFGSLFTCDLFFVPLKLAFQGIFRLRYQK